MQHSCVLGYFWWLWAIVYIPFGVQVTPREKKGLEVLGVRDEGLKSCYKLRLGCYEAGIGV